ncbi:hypothetical protein LIER_17067 [Lithospermum erythrorhizon]|uniref:MULE transposase domain-containing protein n=1 Tax=Lithospermum erythrorhizon TaxID=34254 RepID=A0AAV3QAN6_LITER
MSIKSISGAHIYGPVIKNRQVNVKFLAMKYINQVRRVKSLSVEQFIGFVNDQYKIEISRMMGWRDIKVAGYLIYGNETKQFAKIQSYAYELIQRSFKGQIIVAVGLDADNYIYLIAWTVVEVENTQSWTWFVNFLHEDLGMDIAAEEWIIITDQQKGLENAMAAEIPLAEHPLCVKYLHANWSKRFPGKAFKDMMWKARHQIFNISRL